MGNKTREKNKMEKSNNVLKGKGLKKISKQCIKIS